MKIYQTLLRYRLDNCIAATYNVDLPFFEYLVFEKLYAGGCRNTAVLCDPGQYQLALDDLPLLKHLGHRYLCVPCTAAGASFHPKIVLLTSSEGGLLLMGSNNRVAQRLGEVSKLRRSLEALPTTVNEEQYMHQHISWPKYVPPPTPCCGDLHSFATAPSLPTSTKRIPDRTTRG